MEYTKIKTAKIGDWMRHSVTMKLVSISILILLLLIPSAMIKSVINERESISRQTITEVSGKWSNAQTIAAPILTVPLVFEELLNDNIVEYEENLNILAEKLNIKGTIYPKRLKRGIHEVIVYKSWITISGNLYPPENIKLKNLKYIDWDRAFLTIGLSDLRGVNEQVAIKLGDTTLHARSGSKIPKTIPVGLTVKIQGIDISKHPIDFSFSLDLDGSRNLSFIPLGNTTDVGLESSWKAPSFNGSFLPDDRKVSKEGFQASWRVLALNRNFPQQWIGEAYQSKDLMKAAFGLDLILPVDDYAKSYRSAKYAIMTLVLTFLVFFMVEVFNKYRIHPFQYALVGLALCLFYIMLVAFSEHIGFDISYLLSSVIVISVILGYSIAIFRNRKSTAILAFTLIGTYGFVFVTLQLADYALLLGSVGLITILAVIMYLTRKIDWYNV